MKWKVLVSQIGEVRDKSVWMWNIDKLDSVREINSCYVFLASTCYPNVCQVCIFGQC